MCLGPQLFKNLLLRRHLERLVDLEDVDLDERNDRAMVGHLECLVAAIMEERARGATEEDAVCPCRTATLLTRVEVVREEIVLVCGTEEQWPLSEAFKDLKHERYREGEGRRDG